MLDAMWTATALARASVGIAAERTLEMLGASPDTPSTTAAVDAAWMTRALQASFPGVGVRSIARIGGDCGTTDRARFALAYHSLGTGEAPPETVFVKAVPPEFWKRLFDKLVGLGATEVRFYREVAPGSPVAAPRAFHASLAGPAGRFVLVLEDLAARGVRFYDITARATPEDVRAVLRALAKLHSAFQGSPRLEGDLAWLRRPERNPNAAVERFLCAMAAAPGARKFPDVVPEAILRAVPRIVAARPKLERMWGTGPLTVIHGDSHIGNMYFDGDEVGLFDWQVAQCGQGMRDVSYFLVNSVPTELRVADQREFIGYYLDEMRANGAEPPDMEEAWEQHRAHALYTWIGTTVTAAGSTLQATEIARAGVARACRAVLDLESLDLLDR